MSTQVLVQKNTIPTINERIGIFILKQPTKIKILGRAPIDWLKKELAGYNIYVIDKNKNNEYKSKILPYCANYDRIAILPSNIPLLTKSTLSKCLEIAAIKNSMATKLLAGYIFNANYYRSNNEYFFDSFYTQQENEFYLIETPEQAASAERLLTQRIITRLQASGVTFRNPSSCIVSADTSIGAGSIIMSNCIFNGKCTIGVNCIINNNCTITNTAIGDNASISNSIINKCKIGNNSIISPYCDITKSKIGDNAMIEPYCILSRVTIKKNEHIAERTTLKVDKNIKIGEK